MVGQIPQSTAQPAARTQISQSKDVHMYSTVASSNMPKRNCIPSQLSYVLYNTIRDIGSEEFVWCGYMLVWMPTWLLFSFASAVARIGKQLAHWRLPLAIAEECKPFN